VSTAGGDRVKPIRVACRRDQECLLRVRAKCLDSAQERTLEPCPEVERLLERLDAVDLGVVQRPGQLDESQWVPLRQGVDALHQRG
jgi:hypothetical protein